MSARGWIIGKIRESSNVAEVNAIEDIFIEITSVKGRSFIAAVITDNPINADSVKAVLEHSISPDLLVTIPPDAIWTGGAINLAQENGFGWGGMGELLRAIDCADVSSIQKKEYDFVERGLRQHDNVASFERIDDRLFKVHRHIHDPITVVLINAYELTADHVRHARDVYGDFDAVLKTNPNGNTTANATRVAQDLSAEIFKWGQFLGRLNKP